MIQYVELIMFKKIYKISALKVFKNNAKNSLFGVDKKKK